MSSIRSPEDLYDFSYLQGQDDDDRGPSPNTAALMAPVGNMTPAYVSRTRDGKPRIMDLNNLGLQKGAPSQKQGDPGQIGDNVGKRGEPGNHTGLNEWPRDKPLNDRVSALQAESKAPLQVEIWKHEQRQKVENAVNRIHQAYVSEARGSQQQPDYNSNVMVQGGHTGGPPEVIARQMEPVPPPHTPLGWEQDLAVRTRRATDRIKQEYVDELRQEAHFMDQLRCRSRIQEKLDEEKRQRERQRVRQEMSSPVPSDDLPTRARAQWDQRAPPNVPSWAQQELCAAHANMPAQAPLTEEELDKKRRQLLVQKSKSNKEPKEGKGKKKDKGGKRGSKKKSNEDVVSHTGHQIIPQPPQPYTSNQIVPHPPRKDAGDEYFPHPPRKDSMEEIIPHPPRNQVGDEFVPHPPGKESRSQCIPHQPVAPAKVKETDSSYSKRKRRLLVNGQEIADNRGHAPSIAGMYSQPSSHRLYGPATRDALTAGAYIDSSNSQPCLIPRQTSQQTMCWNSETAKRGLGFKSRQTREAEQEAKSKSAVAAKLRSEARKWW